MSKTGYEEFEASSPENRRLLRRAAFVLDVREVLVQMLVDAGVTRTELAKRLGKTPGFVSQILSGRNLTLATISDVADALGRRLHLEARHDGAAYKEARELVERYQEITLRACEKIVDILPADNQAQALYERLEALLDVLIAEHTSLYRKAVVARAAYEAHRSPRPGVECLACVRGLPCPEGDPLNVARQEAEADAIVALKGGTTP